jgi:hypothetical protein
MSQALEWAEAGDDAAAVKDGHAIETVAQAAAVVPSTIREWHHYHDVLPAYRAWLSRS